MNPGALYDCLLADLGHFEEAVKGFELWPGMSASECAAVQLRKAFLKKYQDNVDPLADDRALKLFEAANTRCFEWSPHISSSWDEILIGELRACLYRFFNPESMPLVSTISELSDSARPGPGASIGARGGDFYTKLFASPLTTSTAGLYVEYRNYIRKYPEWSNAENIRQEHYGSPRVVSGSRLHFVPKSTDISRLICIEPNLNIFYQLGMMHIMSDRLKSFFGIDLSTQPFKNQELARIGSIDDSISTIDLSSASDSMSLKMLRFFLNPLHGSDTVLGILEFLRTPSAYIHGREIKLGMISTMGNGFTFPLQTAFFACIVLAAANARGVKLRFPRGSDIGSFGVFGDDIACPRELTRDVLRLLDISGFSVNSDKTFIEGPFRESCGCDWFSGHNVRGVYVKTLRSQQSRYAIINGLHLWSARTGIPVRRTIRRLLSTVKHDFVPPWENDDAGIKVPFELVSERRVDKHCQSIRYRRHSARPAALRITPFQVLSPKKAKRRIFNPSGLHISMLQGSIVNHSVMIRHDQTRYVTKWGVAPNWNYLPSACSIALQSDWRRWENAVLYSFVSE